VIISLDKTLIRRLESFKALWTVCSETVFWTLNRLVVSEIAPYTISGVGHFVRILSENGMIPYIHSLLVFYPQSW